jgi:oligoendopeptidase F
MNGKDLPHWDLTNIYPGLETREFEEGYKATIQEIADLVRLFDENEIKEQETVPLDEAMIEVFQEVIDSFNRVWDHVQTLRAYIQSFITTDSRNTLAQEKWSMFQPELVKLNVLGTRLTAWIGALDVEALVERSNTARDHAYMLRKSKIESMHLMTMDEEELAEEMSLTGGSAWEKLYGNFSSQLTVRLELKGEVQELPMSAVRNLAFDPDRDIRRRAYEAELAAWEKAALPIAAAMNSIKGEVNSLSKRRKWTSPLELTLFQSNIDQETLDAMMEAAYESFPDFRRYLKAKAQALGLPSLAWFDLFAPVGKRGKAWSFEEAQSFIVAHFSSYSSKLSGLAKRAFEERWIDAEPRAGKRDGAFCMRVRKDESRILSNYQPSFDGVSTLAHELGHAYHNLNLAQRTFLQRSTPMTLAETASIFCQTIIRDAALVDADAEDQLVIVEGSLQDACQVVVDITSRFLFEQGAFQKREDHELSVDMLSELMLDCQRKTYGGGLAPERLHPYMWAVKPHYYRTGLSFYNFPYMFGLLFGLGLYARYLNDPEIFKEDYDDLLSSTGLGDAGDLAKRFGIEIREPDFWRASLDIIRADIERFESLVASGM